MTRNEMEKLRSETKIRNVELKKGINSKKKLRKSIQKKLSHISFD